MTKKKEAKEVELKETPIVKEVRELANEGRPLRIIKAKLTIDGYDDKAIKAIVDAAGIGRLGSRFTETNTLLLLEKGVTEKELYEEILKAEAKNEARWVGARNRTRIVINTVYSNLGSPIEEEPASEELKAKVKALHS